MVERTISWCAANRVPVLAGAALLLLWGWWCIRQTPFDALPDLSDVQVIVSTEWPGRSPDLVEAQVTYPIVTALVSTAGVRAVRSVTDFGISFVHVLFEDGTDVYWARSRVLERLQTLRDIMPAGATPAMGPDATGVGWVFQYALVDRSGRHALDELRSIQDWSMQPALRAVPGVAEIATIGGFVKQYQVNLDPQRLLALNVSPMQVVEAIRSSNNDVEGRVLEFSGREYMVRARGTLESSEDIRQIALGVDKGGVPIRVQDVAEVRIGPDIRRGIAELDGIGEVVGGIVIMRVGENALTVIEGVKERLRDVERSLPEGVTIVPVYDRSQFIERAISTVQRILLEEMIVVSLVVVIFLSHLRAALIPVVALPIAVVASFIPLYYLDSTANIMSLGGIALAIGVVVDAAIVMVENGHRHLSQSLVFQPDRRANVLRAARQVGRAVFFSLAIIVVSFVPVFLLESQEGRMFRPLALTKTAGITASSVLAITLVPVLMVLLLRARGSLTESNALTRFCIRAYEPLLRLALRWRATMLWISALTIPATVLLALTIGREFMPSLYEGSILYMPSAAPGISVTEAARLVQTQDRAIREFPEVERVFGSAGRATTATDNSPLSMVNTTITLKPRDTWRPGVTFETIQAELDRALQIPGVPNVWTQPIRSRVDMLTTGIRTPVGIKILGPDLAVIHQLGGRVEEIVRAVPGARNVYAERVMDGYFADIRIDRQAIARYGLTIRDVEDVIQTAVGGANVGQVIEGRERYPINVRYQYDFRSNLDQLERVLVKTPAGGQVPLGQLSTITLTTGPAMIRDDNGMLAGYVYVDSSTRDLGGFVERARQATDERLTLPAGYRLEWSGQYEAQVRAAARLRLILPAVLVAIFVLLYLTFRSAGEALTVMLSVLYAMTGGVILQWLLGYNFSVAVWVGYISLYGIAVQTGVIMVLYLREALEERLRRNGRLDEDDVREATIAGAVLRLRPKLMTVAATTLGLMPILWSQGIGADVLKPIAVPMVGGMVTSSIHVLFITPIIFFLVKRREVRRMAQIAESTSASSL